jgi:adenine deaminase
VILASNRKEIILASLGKTPLSLRIKNVKLLNVYTGEIIPNSTIGVYGNIITNVSGSDGESGNSLERYKALDSIDAKGAIALPGLIDTHLHIESSMITPARFAEAVLPRGTTTVCADPHEIANVLGKEGVKMMINNSRNLPMKIYFFVPTCVPESKAVTSGAEITPEDVEEMSGWEGICGLGEVMDYKSVLSCDEKMMKILEIGRRRNMTIDGHCVLLSGNELDAYVSSGAEADHENFYPLHDLNKLRAGMFLKLRGPDILDGRKMISALNSLKNPWGVISVTDDVMPDNLKNFGHLDRVVRFLISEGMDPIEAVRSATLRPAMHMKMYKLGALAPGKVADIILLDGKIKEFRIGTVISNGRIVSRNYELVIRMNRRRFDARAYHTSRVSERLLVPSYFIPRLPRKNGKLRINVVDFSSHSSRSAGEKARWRKDSSRHLEPSSFLKLILTRLATVEVEILDGRIDYGRENIALVMVFDRHHKKEKEASSFGFARNLIRSGAMASTVAHDSHNLIVVGTDPVDMSIAARRVVRFGGGIVAVKQSRVLAEIELPIAGLMCDHSIETVAKRMIDLRQAFRELGIVDHPYMPIPCLLTLSVIPHARITNRGIYDVDRERYVNPFIP